MLRFKRSPVSRDPLTLTLLFYLISLAISLASLIVTFHLLIGQPKKVYH